MPYFTLNAWLVKAHSLRRRANVRNVSTSLLHFGGVTYLINSFDYPNLLCFNSPPMQHQFLWKLFPQYFSQKLIIAIEVSQRASLPRQSAGGQPRTSRYCSGRSTARKPTYTGHTIQEFCRPSTRNAPSQMAYRTEVMSQRTAMFITIITKQTYEKTKH